jgi:hypothetical protein
MAKNEMKSPIFGQVEIARDAAAFPLAGLRVRAPDGREVFTAADGSFHFPGLDPAARVEVFAGDAFLSAGRLDQPLTLHPAPSEATEGISTGALHADDAALIIKFVGPERAAPFLAAAATLSSIETLARGYLADGSGADALFDLLERERPWSAKPPPRLQKGPAIATPLALSAPGALPFAGAVIGTMFELTDARNRAVSVFFRYAEPLARAVRTARAIADGRIAPEKLFELSDWAIKVFDEPDINLKDLFKEGPLSWLDPLKGIPPILKEWWWLDPAHQAWAQCVFSTRPSFGKPPSAPNFIFGVKPNAICANAAAAGPVRLALISQAGGFANFDFTEWALTIDGQRATILNQAPDEVEIEVAGLRPGCHVLNWLWLKGGTPWLADAVTPACIDALRIDLPTFGLPPWIINKTPSLNPSLSVVSASIGQFSANGSSGATLSVEACRDTIFSWNVIAQLCARDTSLISVSLLRDGQALATKLPLIGSFVEPGSDQNNTYTLRVVVSDSNGATCGPPLERDISLTRIQRLRLTMPPELRVGATATARVTRSCPAPAGGTTVGLQISPAGRASAPAGVTIPAGNTFVDVALAGLECGSATLTATAPDHVSASASTCVIGPPGLRTPLNSAPIIPCKGEKLNLDLHCVGQELRVVLIAVANGSRTPLSVTPPTNPCVEDTILSITIPPNIAIGDYDVEVSDRGGTVVLGRVSLAPPPASIKLAPPPAGGKLRVPFACSNGAPNTPAEIKFNAVGDRVEITTASGVPPIIVTRPQNKGTCDEWTGKADVFVPCSGLTVNLVAINTGGPSQAISVPIEVDSTGVYSSIRFRNQTGSNSQLRIFLSAIGKDPATGQKTTNAIFGDAGRLLLAPGSGQNEITISLNDCQEYEYEVRIYTPNDVSEWVVRERTTIRGGQCGGQRDVLSTS